MFVDCLHIQMGKQPCLDLEILQQLVTIGQWDYNRINHLHTFVKDFFHPQLIFNYIHTLGEATLRL